MEQTPTDTNESAKRTWRRKLISRPIDWIAVKVNKPFDWWIDRTKTQTTTTWSTGPIATKQNRHDTREAEKERDEKNRSNERRAANTNRDPWPCRAAPMAATRTVLWPPTLCLSTLLNCVWERKRKTHLSWQKQMKKTRPDLLWPGSDSGAPLFYHRHGGPALLLRSVDDSTATTTSITTIRELVLKEGREEWRRGLVE